MRKVLKWTLTVISSLIIFVITVPILLGMLLQVGFIQNYTVKQLTNWLSEKSGTTMTIGRVDIGFFNRAKFEQVYIEDLQGDTLIYAEQLTAGIDGINFLSGEFGLGAVTLTDGVVNLAKDSLGVMNIKYITDKFKPEVPKNRTIRLSAREFNLVNVHFTYKVFNPRERESGINFQDLDLHSLDFQVRNLTVLNDDIQCRIEHMTFIEKSGFHLYHLSSSKTKVDSTGMRFADLKLQTQFSDLSMEHLNFEYDNWGAFRSFVRDVRIDAKIQPSMLAYKTITYFMRRPTEITSKINFEGDVKGPVSNLQGQLRNLTMADTRLDVDFTITGLPDVESSWFKCSVAGLKTDAKDITAIYNDVTLGKGDNLRGMQGLLNRAGKIGFSGTFDGLLRDFTATGLLSTDQGTVEGKLQFMPAAKRGETRLLGHVNTSGFQLGRLLAVKEMGAVTLDAGVDAITGQGMLTLTTDATIAEMRLNGYDYTNVRMDGEFAGRMFEGRISCDDPNVNFSTEGRFDLREQIPAYDFEMELRNANLYALNLNQRDSVSLISARFRAHATGTKLDDINGTATIDSLRYINHIDTVQTGTIRFDAKNDEHSKLITMKSDFADVELRGRNSYSNIFRFFGQSLRKYLPSIPEEDLLPGAQPLPRSRVAQRAAAEGDPNEEVFDNGYYLLKINVKQANNVAAIFVPGLMVAENTAMTFLFNPYLDQFSLSLKSDYVVSRSMYLGKIIAECRNQGDSVSIFTSAEQFGVGNLDFPNFSVIGGIKENRISVATRFSNPENGSSALVSTATTIQRAATGAPQLDIAFYPTTFTVENQLWYIAPSNILIDTTGLEVNRFRMWGEGQQFTIDGKASRSLTDTLRVNMSRLNISPFSALINLPGYRLVGYLGGDAQLVAPLGEMQFDARLRFDSLGINQHQFGQVDFLSSWDRERKWISFDCVTPDGDTPVKGVYDSQQKRYRVDMNFPRMDMQLLEPLLQGALVDTRGEAEAKLILTGTGNRPLLNGNIEVKSYDATVDFTRARYSLAGPVTVVNNRFELPAVPIKDANGGGGTISAWFDSKYFKQLTYGVKADFRDMLCLNTTAQDNGVFYGRAFGTGSFSLTGNDQQLLMDIRAETAKSSSFVLPLSDVSTITEADFIRFVEPRAQDSVRQRDPILLYRRQRAQTGGQRRRRTAKSEMNVNLNLSVLPNTEAQIVMDPRLGDAIKGRGNGRFRINIVPSRDIFTMDGQYDISEGTYLFTLYGVLANKYFIIQPGSSLTWTGDPQDPLVNIDAIYRVRTSLRPLMGANSTSGAGNINVNTGIHLSDRLFNPTVNLSITAPGADTETQNMLRNLLNTEESKSNQFMYLLLANSFMPDNQSNSIGTMSGSLAGVAGMEFLSNQISNLISGSNYNIRFGYRPSSDLTSEEVTFDIGADIISDKLSFEVGGNYDVGQRGIYSNNTNPLSVDGYVTWTLNKSGSLKLKGFTRTIESFNESQGLQDSGVGVYYRQEFQNLRDLKERYRKWVEQRKLNRVARQQKRAQATAEKENTEE